MEHVMDKHIHLIYVVIFYVYHLVKFSLHSEIEMTKMILIELDNVDNFHHVLAMKVLQNHLVFYFYYYIFICSVARTFL